ncbi:TIGR04282 family arsenosugar biosynthesis glycosyltransferase [Azoarcus sp. L1K30]|uniref:TIGR04282 family arsenosugar biosynthesis glycosyltransferase n=1 Tax=Azoarcus sp. L1K30 TaxID=2820277 RepID=UPI001B842218|nr:TIGR04282 family arsenosugar biosynthesis glycosyltransferase [Azoarcus sp. L1K30]MBR0568909.1 TIGR04282 family arsenosugar biosynthesis glycosyltransferase [Azoarcus sp. L1K30]
MNDTHIIIFAKAPVAGFAKTRLNPVLGAHGAARLAQRMLLHTVAHAMAAQTGTVELCVTPSPADPAWHALSLPAALRWSAQGEGDLGARMARAARRVLDAGQPVLLIGTDCPTLDATVLRAAAQALHAHDAVLGPSADGGYVLLGLKRFDAALFDDIPWSTSAVAGMTLARMARAGWRVHQSAPAHDIDLPEDLQWLPADWRVQDRNLR